MRATGTFVKVAGVETFRFVKSGFQSASYETVTICVSAGVNSRTAPLGRTAPTYTSAGEAKPGLVPLTARSIGWPAETGFGFAERARGIGRPCATATAGARNTVISKATHGDFIVFSIPWPGLQTADRATPQAP